MPSGPPQTYIVPLVGVPLHAEVSPMKLRADGLAQTVILEALCDVPAGVQLTRTYKRGLDEDEELPLLHGQMVCEEEEDEQD